MACAFGNAQHIGAREQQQDSFGFTDPNNAAFVAHGGFVAVLADGMGGMQYGDVASRSAVRAFLAAYEGKDPKEPVAAALWRGLMAANGAVQAAMQQAPPRSELGTTFIAAALLEQELHWVSVGDSGLFLYRDGEWTQLNTPHVYARELDARAAAGEISREQALTDPQRDALTSYLNGAIPTEIDRNARPLPLRDDDVIILSSDGLFKTLHVSEMSMAMIGRLQNRCEALVAHAIGKRVEQQDNVTVIALAPREPMGGPAMEAVLSPPPRPRPRRSPVPPRAAVFVLAAAAMAFGYYWRTQNKRPAPAAAREKVVDGPGYDQSKLPPPDKEQR